VASFDGYLFVTPEYNHGVPAALKNAIDLLYSEWNTKAAGFVSYGSDGGVRAVEQLRQVMGQLRIADVTAQVPLPLGTDFVNFRDFAPQQHRTAQVTGLVTELVAWAGALRTLRLA
jgi:NAD(P)H-dependent FMN reductase